ncbi:MAG TPA: glycosyltransferase family 39 protein [Blastocatellia bacterium]|nr:glycosyltransferase family 39 protein [Blastocatellia bacterium]
MRSKDGPRTFFIFITFAILLAGAIIFFVQAFRSIGVQQDIQYPESAVVFGVVNLWRGQPLYHDFQRAPFAITGYTPIFYILSAAISKLFAHSIHAVYLCSRIVAFIATLLTAIIAGLIAKQTGGNKTAQSSTVLFFLSSSLLLPWGFMARVDTLMLFFTVTGIYLFLRFNGSNWQYLSIVAFVLALFTKQSALAAPAAVFVELVFERRWRHALLFASGLFVLCVACFLIGNAMTGGLMSVNVLGSLDAPVRLKSIAEVLWNSLPGLLAGLIFSVAALATTKRSNTKIRLIALYFVFSVILAAVSSAKLGSDRNYYLDALLAVSVLGGIGIGRLANVAEATLSKAILCACIVIGAFVPDLYQKYVTATSDYFVSEDNTAIVDELRTVSGDILTQDANIPLRLGKPVFVTDSYHLSVLEARHKWQPEPLIELIEQKRFQKVMLPLDIQSSGRPPWTIYQGLPIWDPRIVEAISRNYQLAEIKGSYHIYDRR